MLKKCEHGVYIPVIEQDGSTSSYCGVCNPHANWQQPGADHKGKTKRFSFAGAMVHERTMDAADYLLQSPEERIAGARDFFA